MESSVKEHLSWISKEGLERCKNLDGMDNNTDLDFLLNRLSTNSDFVSQYLEYAQQYIGKEIRGSVADLGSGVGCMASVLSKFPNVQEVFAVEYSLNHVKNIMPRVFEKLNVPLDKITRVHADYNFLEFEDNYLDFVLELGAYHHSETIEKTIQETFRILKPGGYFIGIDRSHRDSTPEHVIQELLNRQLKDSQKERYGFKSSDSVTRKFWGEHEYRAREWKKFFEVNGFEINVLRFFNTRGTKSMIKRTIIKPLIPIFLKLKINGIELPGIHDKEKTLLIARKPK